jgi:tRNA (guanine37-N1)-methyltransferase
MYVRVYKAEAEKVRKSLMRLGQLAKNYRILKNGNYVLIPFNGVSYKDYKIVEHEGVPFRVDIPNPWKFLRQELSSDDLQYVKRSYDIIGDIAVLTIPKEVECKEKIIARCIMAAHKNVKVVCKKSGVTSGKFRIRPVQVILGEKRVETIHTEFGCKYKVNLNKVYFNPRLAYERKRIADSVTHDEKIIVMFAGVGPFPILIAKTKPVVNIVAIEINPTAFRLLKENIFINKVKSKITPVHGDVVDEMPKLCPATRIIMPLPKDAIHYFDLAISKIGEGGVIHFYAFGPIKDPFSKIESFILSKLDSRGKTGTILGKKIVRSYSANTVQIVFDVQVD